MLDIQGFIQISPFFENSLGKVSPAGQLSKESWSFSRNTQQFSKAEDQVELVAFFSERDEDPITVPSLFSDKILLISQWIFTQSIAGAFKNDEAEFQRLLIGKFQKDITDVSVGGMVAVKTNWFPRWYSFTLTANDAAFDDIADKNNRVLLWFSDNDFNVDYQHGENYPQMPIEPVDIFMGVKSAVEKAMEGFNLSKHHEEINKRAERFPYTGLVTNYYTWHDRENPDITLSIPMSVLCYGRAAMNPTRVKESLRDYILSHSDYSKTEWAKVFPELFTTTKFTFVMDWLNHGAPNKEAISSQYHPMTSYEMFNKANDTFGGWAKRTVDDEKKGTPKKPLTELCAAPTVYKSLGGVVIAGDENDSRKKSIKDVIPDYALIQSTNPDISFVGKETTAWLRLFYMALVSAEAYNPYQSSVEIVKVQEKDNPDLLYWVFEKDNVEYRIISRESPWYKRSE